MDIDNNNHEDNKKLEVINDIDNTKNQLIILNLRKGLIMKLKKILLKII